MGRSTPSEEEGTFGHVPQPRREAVEVLPMAGMASRSKLKS